MRLAAATPTIHLLVTDFAMPGADGLELAEQFRTVHPADAGAAGFRFIGGD